MRISKGVQAPLFELSEQVNFASQLQSINIFTNRVTHNNDDFNRYLIGEDGETKQSPIKPIDDSHQCFETKPFFTLPLISPTNATSD